MRSNDRPTVAIVGAGGIARPHFAAWRHLGAQIRVFSLQGAEELVAGVDGAEAVPTLEAALDGADLVDICVPTFAHPEVVLAAAAAGCDVICEKPLALTSSQTTELMDACRTAGVRLLPAHVVRFFPEYRAMRSFVAGGGVGEIAVQRFSRSGARPNRAWFADESLSGGIVMDQMIHDLDFARWTAGDVARVFARRVDGPDDGDVRGVVSAQAVLTHVGGAISYATGTWAPPGSVFRTTFEIAGTAGVVQHDSTARSPLQIDGGSAGESRGLLPGGSFTESPFVTELRSFLADLQGGEATTVSADDGWHAVRLAEAANESIATGRAVELTPVTTDVHEGVPA